MRDARPRPSPLGRRPSPVTRHPAARRRWGVRHGGDRGDVHGQALSTQVFLGHPSVGLGAGRIGPVGGDRLTVAGRLGQADAARDHGREHAVTKMTARFRGHVGGQLRARVVHRQEHSLDREPGIEMVADEVDRGDQLVEPFQGVVLALQRDQDLIRRREAVDGQEPERRRTVDEDVLERLVDRAKRPSQAALALGHRGQFHFGAGERHRRGEQAESRDRGVDDEFVHRNVIGERVIGRLDDGGPIDAEPARRVALRVEIDDEDRTPGERQVGRQVDHRGGLADAALLVRACDRLAHSASRPTRYHCT